MAAPPRSDAVTRGVRVVVGAFYIPEESTPEDKQYVFGYRVLIRNESERTVQLLTRHWIIIDADGEQEDVRGDGVVGKTPVLRPGDTFEYQSFCPLSTPWGTMEGSYHMRQDDGDEFDVAIGRFWLTPEISRQPVV